MKERLYLVGEVAEHLGVSSETLKRYEIRFGLNTKRDINGWRRYDEEDLKKLEKFFVPQSQQPNRKM